MKKDLREHIQVSGNKDANHPMAWFFKTCDKEDQAIGERFRKRYFKEFKREFIPDDHVYLATVEWLPKEKRVDLNSLSDGLGKYFINEESVRCLCGSRNYVSYILKHKETGAIINVGANCRKTVWNGTKVMLETAIEVLKADASFINEDVVHAYNGVPHRLLPIIAFTYNRERELADEVIIPRLLEQLGKPDNSYGGLDRESVPLLKAEEKRLYDEETKILAPGVYPHHLPEVCQQVMVDHLGLKYFVRKSMVDFKEYENKKRYEEAYQIVKNVRWSADFRRRRNQACAVLRKLQKAGYEMEESIDLLKNKMARKYLIDNATYYWFDVSTLRAGMSTQDLLDQGLTEYWIGVLIDRINKGEIPSLKFQSSTTELEASKSYRKTKKETKHNQCSKIVIDETTNWFNELDPHTRLKVKQGLRVLYFRLSTLWKGDGYNSLFFAANLFAIHLPVELSEELFVDIVDEVLDKSVETNPQWLTSKHLANSRNIISNAYTYSKKL